MRTRKVNPMAQPDRDNPDGDDSTSGWKEFVRNPVATTPTERTSPEPEDLAEEQARYSEQFGRKQESDETDEQESQ